MTGSDRHIPSPTPDPETAEFWEGAAKGLFLLRHCQECGRFHWYPRTTCPFCWSDNTEWIVSPGNGHIYSCTVFRRTTIPYVIAYVELDEGPRILTNVMTDNVDAVQIGKRVQVTFVNSSDPPIQSVPFFQLAQDQ